MLQEGDRRRYPRRTFRDVAQAFHDGHHFEGTPHDISVGGMLLTTPAVDEVRQDEVLGILLDGDAGFAPPLFLYARVARVREGERPALGLRWERAGSTGDADELANALELLFALPASSFLPAITTGSGRIRTTYVFPRQPAGTAPGADAPTNGDDNRHPTPAPSRSGASLPPLKVSRLRETPLPGPLRGLNGGPIGLSVTEEELDQLDVRVRYDAASRAGRSFKRAYDVDAGTLEPTPLADGSLPTREGAASPRRAATRDDDDEARERRAAKAARRAPVHFDGVMTAAHTEIPVLVTGIGTTSVFVESALAPLDREARVALQIDVRLRDGVRPFFLNCGLEKVHLGEYGTPPGVELTILSFDDPRARDEFSRLVEVARHGRP